MRTLYRWLMLRHRYEHLRISWRIKSFSHRWRLYVRWRLDCKHCTTYWTFPTSLVNLPAHFSGTHLRSMDDAYINHVLKFCPAHPYVSNLVCATPETLDTLQEVSDALNADRDFDLNAIGMTFSEFEKAALAAQRAGWCAEEFARRISKGRKN